MDTSLAKRIGEAAREARKARGLTQEDAAERAGVSYEFYARIERGGTLPSVPTLVRFCEALQVTADGLLGGGAVPAAALGTTNDTADPLPLRRLLRRLRRASPRTIRLLGLIAAELERPRPSPRRSRAR